MCNKKKHIPIRIERGTLLLVPPIGQQYSTKTNLPSITEAIWSEARAIWKGGKRRQTSVRNESLTILQASGSSTSSSPWPRSWYTGGYRACVTLNIHDAEDTPSSFKLCEKSAPQAVMSFISGSNILDTPQVPGRKPTRPRN